MVNVDPIDILLVEDNPNDVELTLRALKRHNLVNGVVVARDGAEALEVIFGEGAHADKFLEKHPKLVLLDLKLPKVNGLDVLRKIKSDERKKVIPVVVLTSSREEQDIVESYKLGVNSYMVKPVDFDKFSKSVSEIGFYWLVCNEPPS
jgi:two-component system response regulator